MKLLSKTQKAVLRRKIRNNWILQQEKEGKYIINRANKSNRYMSRVRVAQALEERAAASAPE